VRILKSMPIVVIKEGVNWSSLNRRRRHDLPTPIQARAHVSTNPRDRRGGESGKEKGARQSREGGRGRERRRGDGRRDCVAVRVWGKGFVTAVSDEE
jgi:hypothetical protein